MRVYGTHLAGVRVFCSNDRISLHHDRCYLNACCLVDLLCDSDCCLTNVYWIFWEGENLRESKWFVIATVEIY
jgi:hypothetical protein